MRSRAIILLLLLMLAATASLAQSTAFTYQGSLQQNGTPANGSYDLEFRLYDSLTGGNEVNSFIQTQNFPVVNGQFTISLNFGPVFTGAPRYLEVRVRTAGATTFTTLTPRTLIATTPYAVRSLSAETLNGVAANQYVLTTDSRMTDARNPLPNSGNYIQNIGGPTPQANANFNISGTGTANVFNAQIVSAVSEYYLGNQQFMRYLQGSTITVGYGAGAPTLSSRYNSLFGVFAGSNTSTGEFNSIFGYGAGASNTTGNMNSYFGANAGFRQSGSFNSIFGSTVALGIATRTGDFNSFFGHRAGQVSNGNFNSFFGTGAGFNNDTGSSNTFIGRNSGDANTVGSFNVTLGEYANLGNGSLTNAVAIGSKAFVTQSNSLVLGSINGVNGATADTNVGIGLTAPTARLSVVGGGFGNNLLVSDSNPTATTFDLANSSVGGRTWRFQSVGSGSAATVGNLELWSVGGPPVFSVRPNGEMTINRRLNYFDQGGNANFYMKAAGAANGINFGVAGNSGSNSTLYVSQYDGTTYQDRLILDNNGNLSIPSISQKLLIGTTSPQTGALVEINGKLSVGLDSNGTIAVCRTTNGILAFCSSSIRYKRNVLDYTSALEIVRRLRPVTFDWKSNGMHDLGLVAEEVADVEPLLTTTNDKGEVEGVKYDRIGVVLVNAVNEQQNQIELQKQRISEQDETIKSQNDRINRQQAEIDALKKIVCAQNKDAEICRENR